MNNTTQTNNLTTAKLFDVTALAAYIRTHPTSGVKKYLCHQLKYRQRCCKILCSIGEAFFYLKAGMLCSRIYD